MKYEKDSEIKSEDLASKKIDWDDYNYPCCLKIFHYDSSETPSQLRCRVRLMFINHLLILFFLPWNFITNIVGTAQGVQGGGIRIAISVFLALLVLPGAFYIFIIPYQAYLGQQPRICLYYIISLVIAVWSFIWSIADFADANGWVMAANSSKMDMGALTFFSVISSLACTAIAALSLINLVFFYRRTPVTTDQ